jgi:hypothetical protein
MSRKYTDLAKKDNNVLANPFDEDFVNEIK